MLNHEKDVDMKKTFIVVSYIIVNAWVLKAFADGPKYGGEPTSSTMEEVIKKHEVMKKEREFTRRTGMPIATVERLRKLSMTNTVENRTELMRWFRTLPQAKTSSYPRQPEKTAIVKALGSMMSQSEFKTFGLGVLDSEINALREAKKWEQENYYPRDVIFAIFENFSRDIPDSDIVDTLSAYAKDGAVAYDVRARFKALLMKQQFLQAKVLDLEKQAKIVIAKLINPPTHPIPWGIYKDKDKRIAYGNSKEYTDALRKDASWRFSEEYVENNASEQFLLSLGMAAVPQLIQAVNEDRYTGEKRDYLIFLATDILVKHLLQGGTLSENEQKCLNPLHKLFGTMPDLGAFCWRHRTAGNMNKIYECLEIDEKVKVDTDFSVSE